MSSNIVKWNYIQFDNQEKCIIASDERRELLADILSLPQETIDSALKQSEETEKQFDEITDNKNVIHCDEMLEEERERLEQEAEELLVHAKQEAAELIEAAKKEVDTIKQSAYQVGKTTGYEDGMRQSQQELIERKMKLEDEKKAYEAEYNRLLEGAEPQFVDILIRLIEKITGVIIENKKEVILHLVHKGIHQIGRSEKYIIHCSPEDYMMLEEEKGRLCNAVGKTEGIEILEDVSFQKNQCIIETDNKILDCSLDIQLKELIDSLKLMNIEI